MTTSSPAKDKIILPLDLPDETSALRMIDQLQDAISFYKVGLELFTRCGPEGTRRIRDAIKSANPGRGRLFLDLKLLDIPNTVAGAVRSVAELGADLLTVHLCGGSRMLRAAANAVPPDLLLLGVTVLTSSDETTLRETGIAGTVEEQVLRLARLGNANGFRGLVCSPHEITLLRAEFGAAMKIVTPGVRPRWGNPGDDQRRIMTPGEAVAAGADFLVIGRPITAHPDPHEAAQRIAEEMTAASPP